MGRHVLIAVLSCILACQALADGDSAGETYQRASHLSRSTWVLWSPHADANAVQINTETDAFVPIDVSGFYNPWCFLPVPGAPSQGGWLYALDLRTDGDVSLARIRLEGGGSPEVKRVYRRSEDADVANLLRPGPDGTMVTAVERENQWWLEVLDPLTAAVVQQVGPLSEQPRDAIPWNRGRWLILDHSRVWSWPDEQVWFYSEYGAPRRWDEPPRMIRWGWPESLVLLSETHLLAGSTSTIFEMEGDFEAVVAGAGWGTTTYYPADGPSRDAAVRYLGPPTRAGTRIFTWERGGQRLLRLHYHAERREWLFQTLYESPAGVVDVSARTPPPLPQTVDAVLEAWVGLPWVDLEGETPASFLLHHRHEMFILASHLDEAVPKLLEHRNASAAFALSLLRADVAEPWLRELVMDSTQYGWESGCSYPTSSIGIVALEQLHGLPVHELMKIKPSDRRDMNRAIEAADQLEGMDRWCGEGGFARHILAAFEPAE